jgi:hypothetical protein
MKLEIDRVVLIFVASHRTIGSETATTGLPGGPTPREMRMVVPRAPELC